MSESGEYHSLLAGRIATLNEQVASLRKANGMLEVECIIRDENVEALRRRVAALEGEGEIMARDYNRCSSDEQAAILAAAIEQAEDWGADGWRVYDGSADWDQIGSDLEEALDVDLPGDWEDLFWKKVKAAYRKARREANG